MGEWRTVRIGDLGRVVTGKTPSTTEPDNFYGPYPFVTIPDLNGYVFIDRTERSLSEKGAGLLRSCLLPANAVMMSCIATIGRCGITTKPSFTNQQINSVICGQDANPRFLYYSFTQLGHKLEAAGGGGSVYTNVSKSRFSDIAIGLPPMQEQRAITHILGTLDDLIELNRRTNETLEQIARTLFNHYFQHSPEDDLPEGWWVGTVDDIAEINARTLSKSDDLAKIEYVEISEVNRGNIGNVQVFERGQEPSRARRRLRYGDTVLSTVRPDRGAYFLCLDPSPNLIASTGFIVLTPLKVPWSFLHAAVTRPEVSEYLGQHADGGAYPAVRPDIISRMRLALPEDAGALEAFHKISAPLFELMEKNRRSSRTLAALRDLLLPILLSGKYKIS